MNELVSIVVPALDEADNAPVLMGRMQQFARANPAYDFELVLVDDGSTDGTAEQFLAMSAPGVSLTVVQLARRFGSHQAISAGLKQARGACAIVIGADAQEPPHLVTEFLEQWRGGAEIVWGVRRTRVGRSWRAELASRLFSYLFTRFARLEHYPPEGPSGMLLDRCVIDEVNKLEERNRNLMALVSWLGYRQSQVLYDQLPRHHGQSGWTPTRMVRLAVDSLLQFSTMPLRACTFSGLAVAALGVAYAALLVVRGLLGVETPSGWPTILVVVLFLGGVQLTVIGVMGEYLWRAVEEVRRRPLYVVRRIHSSPVTSDD
jgi:polyisoprenyl-phosphate glycosyltransferase